MTGSTDIGTHSLSARIDASEMPRVIFIGTRSCIRMGKRQRKRSETNTSVMLRPMVERLLLIHHTTQV